LPILKRVSALHRRIIQFRIKRSRVLELRIGGLATDGRVAEAADNLRVESARDVGRGGQTLDPEQRLQAGPAEIERLLAAQNVIESDARFKQRRGRDRPGVADGGQLEQCMNVAVRVAARRTRIERAEELKVLLLAEAQEGQSSN